MKEQEINISEVKHLRKTAEEVLNKKEKSKNYSIDDMTQNELEGIIHELEVHEIELQMQNEALRLNQLRLEESQSQYFKLYDLAPVAYCSISDKGIILKSNLKLSALLGIDREKIIGTNLSSYIYDDDVVIFYKQCRRLFKELDGILSRNLRLVRAKDDIVWVRIEAEAEKNDKGEMVCRVIVNDITELKNIQESIYTEKEQFRTTLMSVGDGVISTDSDGRVKIMNQISEQMTGYKSKFAYGEPIDDIYNVLDSTTRERVSRVYNVIKSGEQSESENDSILIAQDGSERIIQDIATPIKDERGTVCGAVIVFRDFTLKKIEQEKIKHLSYNDQLTGLYNRRFLEEEIARLDTTRNLPLSLVMIDVNGLKLTNDAFGHSRGDQVLIRVANVMKKECRSDDIIARIGGDEFVILLPKTDTIQTEMLMQRIHKLLFEKSDISAPLSVSTGHETIVNSEQKIMDIFKKAEDKMYFRKLSESRSMHYKTVTLIMKALYENSNREELHSERVKYYCSELGNALKWGQEEINELETLGLMHDIGKITIDDDILNKKSALTNEEWQKIKRHPEIGFNILKSTIEYSALAETVLAHHERWDGTGYPQGLKGEAIPLKSRIISIAEAYDAMTSERPYHDIKSKEEAINELEVNMGSQFDPMLVKIFASWIK